MGTLVGDVVREIREAEQRLEVSAQSTVQRACDLGKLLIRAKASVAHGAWESWVESVFEGRRSVRWVQEMMLVSERCERNPELLGMTSLRSIAASCRVRTVAGGAKPRITTDQEGETPKRTEAKAQRAALLDVSGKVQSAECDSAMKSADVAAAGSVDSAATISRRIIADLRLLAESRDPMAAEAMEEVRAVAGMSSAADRDVRDEPLSTKALAVRIVDDYADLESRVDAGDWPDVVIEQVSGTGVVRRKRTLDDDMFSMSAKSTLSCATGNARQLGIAIRLIADLMPSCRGCSEFRDEMTSSFGDCLKHLSTDELDDLGFGDWDDDDELDDFDDEDDDALLD